MTSQPHKINSNADNQSLEELAKEAVERGNSIEIHRSKDGIKVFEVSKKLIRTVTYNETKR